MAEESLERRVPALEAQLGGKTIQEHFREQAELIDRRLSDGFREQAELIGQLFVYRFDEFDKKWEAKLDASLESKLEPIRNDMAAVKKAVEIILTRLT